MQSGQMAATHTWVQPCLHLDFYSYPSLYQDLTRGPFSMYPNPLLQIPSCEGDVASHLSTKPAVVRHGETTRSCAMERRWEQRLQSSRRCWQRRFQPNRQRLCQPSRRRLWHRRRHVWRVESHIKAQFWLQKSDEGGM
ncbi:hypothetical protein ACQJBY_009699 [Aegilops geniculata]